MPNATAFLAPILEIEPVAAHARRAIAERARLAGAGGRLPIEEAMARVAERGPDAVAPLPGGAPGGTREAAPGTETDALGEAP